MKIDSITRLNMLFDVYANLLTDKQRELFELHYQYDLSLGEIGENFGVSRQAVHDLLRRTISQLDNYEDKLMLLEKELQRQDIYTQVEQAVETGDMDGFQKLMQNLKNA